MTPISVTVEELEYVAQYHRCLPLSFALTAHVNGKPTPVTVKLAERGKGCCLTVGDMTFSDQQSQRLLHVVTQLLRGLTP